MPGDILVDFGQLPPSKVATFTEEQMDSWTAHQHAKFHHYAIQVDDGKYRGYPPDVVEQIENMNEQERAKLIGLFYFNHSCDANAWFASETHLIARRNIQKGEEVYIDYAMSESEEFTMKCRCGTMGCRQIVSGNDWKLPHVQQQYKNHFMPYLNAKIENANQ